MCQGLCLVAGYSHKEAGVAPASWHLELCGAGFTP